MSNRIIIACIMWISIFAAVALTGCSPEQVPAQRVVESRGADGASLRDAFRVRRDEARSRIWLLGVDDVRVYDSVNGRLIRTIALPNWSVARFSCDPDMVLDGEGSAIISSNAQSRLWRIDASSLEVSEHEIRLQGREQWDAGFGALAYAADGSLLALMSFGGSLWNIELDRGIARMVPPSKMFFNACGSTMHYRRTEMDGVGQFTNFVPAAGSDYAVGSVIDAGQAIAFASPILEGGREP
jgi:hypothetical protein